MDELKSLVRKRYKSMLIVAFSATQSAELKRYRLSRIEEYSRQIIAIKENPNQVKDLVNT